MRNLHTGPTGIDLNGKPYKVVKYATDVTKQVLVRMGNERVRAMMESVAAGAEELNASVREISEAMTKSRETASDAVERVEKADEQAKTFVIAAALGTEAPKSQVSRPTATEMRAMKNYAGHRLSPCVFAPPNT
jgi:hypothetical protein